MPPKRGFAAKRGGWAGRNDAKRRHGSDDDDSAPRANKKAKDDDGEDSAKMVPKLEVDDENNEYVSLNASGKRRVTISSFKGNTLVSIREYWTNDEGELKPGKKGISMTIDQYNTLLAAAPLLEAALAKKDVQVARPDYDAAVSGQKDASADEEGDAKEEDENEEDDDDE